MKLDKELECQSGESGGDSVTSAVIHLSSQVGADPVYVTRILGQLAGRRADDDWDSSVILGYN
ncbi:hypothetical protein R69927_07203 [Paraburkholderia domus]|uniref:hypothetical protein n=1 Tax=Paraburkholderia domus TaxID=2793075 RepID=UPI00191246DA|nr:hypothetical protein [Paraburkholderia domus]MBK5091247.1 hypothetical protein [Burkholderia sp. R-69927]CAE6931872.1 hypothetical protein R69927_07203 [Paraburkholderia domus]